MPEPMTELRHISESLPRALPELPDSDTLMRVLVEGDLSRLSAEQKLRYYTSICESVGLNPLLRPFDYLLMKGGKLVLYASRACTEQLRKKYRISIRIIDKQLTTDAYVVTARASFPDGREDESTGAVPITPYLKGEDFTNALMKAETKAKRRVTLSICGLGMLDESEVESVPGAKRLDLERTGPAVSAAASPEPQTQKTEEPATRPTPAPAVISPRVPAVPTPDRQTAPVIPGMANSTKILFDEVFRFCRHENSSLAIACNRIASNFIRKRGVNAVSKLTEEQLLDLLTHLHERAESHKADLELDGTEHYPDGSEDAAIPQG